MILDELRDGSAAVLLGEEEGSRGRVLLYVVVLDLRVRDLGVEREGVESLGRGVADDKAALLVLALEHRFGSLTGNVRHVPGGRKVSIYTGTTKWTIPFTYQS